MKTILARTTPHKNLRAIPFLDRGRKAARRALSSKAKVSGVIVPLITPFNEGDGSIDISSYMKHARYLTTRGIRGFVVGGTTGEGHQLTLPEKKALIHATVNVRDSVARPLSLIAG